MDKFQLAGFGIVSLIPILGWLWFFLKRQPEKKSYVALTFVAGMLAVIPIKLYEKYWDHTIAYLEHINIFEYLKALIDSPVVSKFLAYTTVHAFVAVGLFLLVAMMMFILEVFSGDNSVKIFKEKAKKIWESPAFFIVIGVICGLVAFLFSTAFSSLVWFFVIVGMLEEYVKHLVLRFTDDDKIRSVDDAIEFSIIIALGFVFVENILYFEKVWANGASGTSMIWFVFMRSTVSVIAHVCFSAILGYFYGIARFSEEIYLSEYSRKQHLIINKLQQIIHLKGQTIFHDEKMIEGMFLAMAVHAIFNSLLEFEKSIIVVPFLLILLVIVLNLFHRKKIHTKEGHFFSI